MKGMINKVTTGHSLSLKINHNYLVGEWPDKELISFLSF